ncbi:MAG: hypothetical protein ACFCUE_08915 [Candidatus Bathyarchaeia archaeon]|jgi:hypothetical protein
MSTDNRFMDWCRMPPEPPKNKHKKLFAGSLIFVVLSVSLFACLPLFNVGMMAGQTGVLGVTGVVLSVANLAEGPKYIQNVTYQCVNDTYQSVQDICSDILRFGCSSGHRDGDLGYATAKIINNGETNLTVTAIEIYHVGNLFAVINGPFTVEAHSEGLVNFQVFNLTELSKSEVQWITGKDEITVDWVQYWYPVLYRAVLKTSEGITVTDDCFFFPTAPGSGAT